MDDTPPKNPLETTERLQDGFISEYAAEYAFAARQSHFPPAAAIEKAYAASTVADDPGLFNSEGEEVTEAEIEDHYAEAELDATNDLIRTVTSVNYQMPRSTRCRIPSGPYRYISDDERDLITM